MAKEGSLLLADRHLPGSITDGLYPPQAPGVPLGPTLRRSQHHQSRQAVKFLHMSCIEVVDMTAPETPLALAAFKKPFDRHGRRDQSGQANRNKLDKTGQNAADR